jgi:hypothetical protein
VRALTAVKIAVPGRESPTIREISRIRIPVTFLPPWKRFEEYSDFTEELVGTIAAAQVAGKTSERAVSAVTLSERFKTYDLTGAASFAEVIYAESPRGR